jgi:hypothetical protein
MYVHVVHVHVVSHMTIYMCTTCNARYRPYATGSYCRSIFHLRRSAGVGQKKIPGVLNKSATSRVMYAYLNITGKVMYSITCYM